MSKKLFASGLMLVALFGGAFAFFGHGMSLGLVGEEVSDEARFGMMSAMHNGDYEAAKQLSEQNGFGPIWLADEQVLALKTQMHDALREGDYESFSALKEQMHEQMQELKAEQGFEGKGFGKMGGNSRGMHREGGFGGCPFAQTQ